MLLLLVIVAAVLTNVFAPVLTTLASLYLPLPFRPGNPALCGSCPLVTPYYCRLGDLLCFICVYRFVCALLSLRVCLCCFRCLICLL